MSEHMTYQDLAHFSATWGLVFLVVIFLSAVAWALWPSNKARFDDAAQVPLREDEEQIQ